MTNVPYVVRIRQNSSTISGLFGFSRAPRTADGIPFTLSLSSSEMKEKEDIRTRITTGCAYALRNLYVSNLDDKLLVAASCLRIALSIVK